MQIAITSVMVNDQDQALSFYTSKLGFEKRTDVSTGEFRWLTVVSPDGVDGVELLLEPTAFPPSRQYQKALYDAGIPCTVFFTKDVHAEYAKLKGRGVTFRGEPVVMGPVTAVLFEDTCGNLINLVQHS
ncbi:MAG: VOC family protein [Telluria sp.]